MKRMVETAPRRARRCLHDVGIYSFNSSHRKLVLGVPLYRGHFLHYRAATYQEGLCSGTPTYLCAMYPVISVVHASSPRDVISKSITHVPVEALEKWTL
jgi:hypothetical protein